MSFQKKVNTLVAIATICEECTNQLIFTSVFEGILGLLCILMLLYMYSSPDPLQKVQFICVENWLRNYRSNQYPERISEIWI